MLVGVERALDLEVGELGSGLSILAMSQSLSFFICKMKIIKVLVPLSHPLLISHPVCPS